MGCTVRYLGASKMRNRDESARTSIESLPRGGRQSSRRGLCIFAPSHALPCLAVCDLQYGLRLDLSVHSTSRRLCRLGKPVT